jgi:hypothetical protein
MKMTVDIPDELYHRIKAKAAQEGSTIKAMIVEGLRLVLEQPASPKRPRRVKFPLIKAVPGQPKITDEMLNKAMEQMDQAEAEHQAQLAGRNKPDKQR